MTDEPLFRYFLLAGFLLFVPLGAWHRIRARTGEKLDRRQEGLFMLVAVRLVGITGMGSFIAYLIHPAWMAWASVLLPTWLRWLGLGLGLLGGTLILWTFHNLGRNLTDTVVTRKQHTLVTTGPYRWIRHPFYTSALLAILANSLAAANWFFFAAGALMFLLLVIRSRKEEENLIARFGDEYRNYRKRTGRFVPRF
jgi:protein-S-isoprenylcysteine O-methyltransferase Ste14